MARGLRLAVAAGIVLMAAGASAQTQRYETVIANTTTGVRWVYAVNLSLLTCRQYVLQLSPWFRPPGYQVTCQGQ